MKIISLIAIMAFLGSPIKGQIIKGRLFNYDDNKPRSHVNVFADSTLDLNYVRSIEWSISDTNGVFILDSLNNKNRFHLIFQSVGVETLIIKDIPFNNDTLDLGAIYLLQGSYHWDGECTRKYFWGLIKLTKGCSGEVIGVIEENPDKDYLNIEYPKGQAIKRFKVIEKALVLDYNNLE